MRSAIYIDRNNLYYYGGNVHAPVAFPFPKTSVTDMEVVNQSELSTKIAEWIKTNKIEPLPTLILLSNTVYFQKEIPDGTPPDQQSAMKKTFIENVPFNDTHVQEIIAGKSTLLIAINTEFVYAIRDVFHSFGFEIETIAPIAEVYGLEPVTSFSAKVAQDALKKISKDNGFPLQPAEDTTTSQSEDPLPQKQENKRLYYMLAVFVVLAAILAFVYFNQRNTKSKKVVIRQPTTIPAQPIASTPTAAATSEASLTIKKENLKIQILNGSGIPGQADTIRKELEDRGFDQITTGNATGVQTSRALIVVKKEVSEEDRNTIIEVIELFADDYTLQEKSDIVMDVLITTSQRSATTTP